MSLKHHSRCSGADSYSPHFQSSPHPQNSNNKIPTAYRSVRRGKFSLRPPSPACAQRIPSRAAGGPSRRSPRRCPPVKRRTSTTPRRAPCAYPEVPTWRLCHPEPKRVLMSKSRAVKLDFHLKQLNGRVSGICLCSISVFHMNYLNWLGIECGFWMLLFTIASKTRIQILVNSDG